MASSRPLRVPVWAVAPTDPLAQLVGPDNVRQAQGFRVNKKPPAPLFNWLFNRVGAWLQFHRHLDVKNWLRGEFVVDHFAGEAGAPTAVVSIERGYYAAINGSDSEAGESGYTILRARDGVEWEDADVITDWDESTSDPHRITALAAKPSNQQLLFGVRRSGDNHESGLQYQRAYSWTPGGGLDFLGKAFRNFVWMGYSSFHDKWLVLSLGQLTDAGKTHFYQSASATTASIASGPQAILSSANAEGPRFQPKSMHSNAAGFTVCVGFFDGGFAIATSTNLTAWTERDVPEGGATGLSAWYDETDQLWMTGNLRSLDGITWEVMTEIPARTTERPVYRHTCSDGRGMWVMTMDKRQDAKYGRYRTYFSDTRGEAWIHAAEGKTGSGAAHYLATDEHSFCVVERGGSMVSLRTSNGNAVLASGEPQIEPGEGGDPTDHGALDGLGDDDHPQYLLRSEYYPPIRLKFRTATTGDPAAGEFLYFGESTPAEVEAIKIDDVVVGGVNIAAMLQEAGAGYLTFRAGATHHRYRFTEAIDDGTETLFTVYWVGGEGTFADQQECVFEFDASPINLTFRTGVLTAVNVGAYGDVFTAEWDLAALWSRLPNNCAIAATITWAGGVLSGTADDAEHDIAAFQRVQLTYNDGILIQAKDQKFWGTTPEIQYSAVAQGQVNNGAAQNGALNIATDGGLVTAELTLPQISAATRARATLRIEENLQRNELT